MKVFGILRTSLSKMRNRFNKKFKDRKWNIKI